MTITEAPLYSVVVPVYRNESTLLPLLDEIKRLYSNLDGSMEVVFVVDGSPDHSYAILHRSLPEMPFQSQLIAHSRNFGSHAAVRTGLNASRGTYVAVMCADLQEPIDLVQSFYAELSSGEFDIAVGRREARSDPFFTQLASTMFWRMYRSLVDNKIPKGGVDVFGCTRPVIDQLMALGEAHSSLIGHLFWIGYRRVEIPYVRVERESGSSVWTWKKKLRYFSDSVFSFTDLPILLLAAGGAIGGLLTIVAAIVIAIARVTGVIHQAGYTPLMLVILLSTFTLILALAIVGSYVWRTYENSKARPIAITRVHEHFE